MSVIDSMQMSAPMPEYSWWCAKPTKRLGRKEPNDDQQAGEGLDVVPLGLNATRQAILGQSHATGSRIVSRRCPEIS
jgi:hypothetical protein